MSKIHAGEQAHGGPVIFFYHSSHRPIVFLTGYSGAFHMFGFGVVSAVFYDTLISQSNASHHVVKGQGCY